MDRVILHIDCNKFFASVECLHRPELRDKPVAVGGNEEKRHGIVLTCNQIAAGYGVKTAEPLWQAKRKCPELVIVPPNYQLYLRFSKLTREIYEEYTDLVEPFGLDECWLDITHSLNREKVAEEIRERVKRELGITVSIGVSWNKVFAKLGSDYKKPDAITVFSRENYKELIYPLPVGNLLYVGKATTKKLNARGIFTIGDLAQSDPQYLMSFLGKNGFMLSQFARGTESSCVACCEDTRDLKSISNSVTASRDLVSLEDIKLTLMVIGDCVARRLREHGFKCKTVCLCVRDKNLNSYTRQCKLITPTSLSKTLVEESMKLFIENTPQPFAIRSIGIAAADLTDREGAVQFDLFGEAQNLEKLEKLENTIDGLKHRYGSGCVKNASLLKDKELTDFEPHDDVAKAFSPESAFKGGF